MIQTLKDFEKVHALLTSKDRLGTITDDNSPGMFEVAKFLLSNPAIAVLMPTEGTMFTFTSINSILFEAHLTTTGKDKVNLYSNTSKAVQWMKDNSKAEILISNIPVIYKTTLKYSENIGMKQIGVIPKAYAKNGERIDIITVSASVNEIIRRSLWHQQ